MTKNIGVNKIIALSIIIGLVAIFYLSVSIKKAEASEQILPGCSRCPGGGKWDPLLRKCQFGPLPLIACTAQYDPVCGCVFDNGKPNYVTFSNSCLAVTRGIVGPIKLDPDGDGVINSDICPPLKCFAPLGGGGIAPVSSGGSNLLLKLGDDNPLVRARLSGVSNGSLFPKLGRPASVGSFSVSGAVDCRGLTSAECESKYPTSSVVCPPGQTCAVFQ